MILLIGILFYFFVTVFGLNLIFRSSLVLQGDMNNIMNCKVIFLAYVCCSHVPHGNILAPVLLMLPWIELCSFAKLIYWLMTFFFQLEIIIFLNISDILTRKLILIQFWISFSNSDFFPQIQQFWYISEYQFSHTDSVLYWGAGSIAPIGEQCRPPAEWMSWAPFLTLTRSWPKVCDPAGNPVCIWHCQSCKAFSDTFPVNIMCSQPVVQRRWGLPMMGECQIHAGLKIFKMAWVLFLYLLLCIDLMVIILNIKLIV